MRVQVHLSSKSTSCHTHSEELISITQILRPKKCTPNPPPVASQTIDESINAWTNEHVDMGNDAMDVNEPGPFCGTFYDRHPSPSQTYIGGHSFMDAFDMDKHAGKRSEQPYYPFAS